jgi:uncharacterized membrane protein
MTLSAFAYALGAVICLAFADFFLKLSSSRISTNLNALIYAMTAVVPPALWVVWAKFSNVEMQVTRGGIIASALTGIFFSLVVIFLSLTFASGGNLSIASPAIRLSALVLASFLGILILGEVVSLRWVLGVLLTFAGIYFIITR